MRSALDFHALVTEASRREHVKGFNRSAQDYRPQLVNRKLERKAVDPNAISKLLKGKVDQQKAADEHARKKKEHLLEKRLERDGGATARRMLANQKATVKITTDKTDKESREHREYREKASTSSSKSKDKEKSSKKEKVVPEWESLTGKKLDKPVTIKKPEKKRKSDTPISSDASSKKRREEGSSKKKDPKKSKAANARPARPVADYHTLLNQAAKNKLGEKQSNGEGRKPKSSKNDSSTSNVAIETDGDDNRHLSWGLTHDELKWYYKIREKQESCARKNKDIKLDSFEMKMRDKIKNKKKAAEKARKDQKLKQKYQSLSNNRKSSPCPPPPPPKPKGPLNAYAKREIKSGKKIDPKIEAKPKPHKSIEKTKTKKAEKPKGPCSISIQSSAPEVKLGRVVSVRPQQPAYSNHKRPWPPNPMYARSQSYDDVMYDDSEEDDDDDLDGFIDDDGDDVVGDRVGELMRKSCPSLFQLKSGRLYDSKVFASQERGLSDAMLARNMRTSAREINDEERKSKYLGRMEDKEELLRKGTATVGNDVSDDSDY